MLVISDIDWPVIYPGGVFATLAVGCIHLAEACHCLCEFDADEAQVTREVSTESDVELFGDISAPSSGECETCDVVDVAVDSGSMGIEASISHG